VWLVTLYAGVLVSSIDITVRRLPTSILAGTAAATIALTTVASLAVRRPQLLLTVLTAGAAVGVAYVLLALVLGSRMGLGDVRLAAVLGMSLGTLGWHAVLLGALLPYLLAAPFAALRLARGEQDLPFGPFLVTGAVATAVFISL
jgi:leader peptidase (prepilin peptidase)/N-methyltransferase